MTGLLTLLVLACSMALVATAPSTPSAPAAPAAAPLVYGANDLTLRTRPPWPRMGGAALNRSNAGRAAAVRSC